MQSDDLGLVERIRAACVGHPHAKIAWPHRILHEAADALAAKDAAIERLVAERDEAREALKPFAKYTDELNGFLDNHNQPIPDDQGPGWVYVTIGDFRRARQALKDAP